MNEIIDALNFATQHSIKNIGADSAYIYARMLARTALNMNLSAMRVIR